MEEADKKIANTICGIEYYDGSKQGARGEQRKGTSLCLRWGWGEGGLQEQVMSKQSLQG